MSYLEKLKTVQAQNNSWLCIGLDPVLARLRVDFRKWDEPILPYNRAIIDATADLVCAYKPNLGFYLQWGAAGVIALERTIAYIPRHIPIVLDCKTGDIGHTQAAWANGLFDEWQVDAVTVNPYMGLDTLEPFLEQAEANGKGVVVLARTSNPGSSDFQARDLEGAPLYARVVEALARAIDRLKGADGWSSLMLVAGATGPDEARHLPTRAPPELQERYPCTVEGSERWVLEASARRRGVQQARTSLLSTSRARRGTMQSPRCGPLPWKCERKYWCGSASSISSMRV